MATPPTVTEVYEATWTSTTSPRTTGTLTVAQGDVLYVIAGGSSSNGALTLSDSTSSAIAWTATSLTTSGYSPVYLWTATIPSGVTSLTITITRASGSSYYGFNVFRATNCGGVGTPVTASGTSGGPSAAITTGQSNSVIAYASSVYAADAGVPGIRSRQPGMSPEKIAMAEAVMMVATAAMGER